MVIWHTPVDQYHYYKKSLLLLDKVNRNSYITNTLYVRVCGLWSVRQQLGLAFQPRNRSDHQTDELFFGAF